MNRGNYSAVFSRLIIPKERIGLLSERELDLEAPNLVRISIQDFDNGMCEVLQH